MTFVSSLLHDTLVLVLALSISIPLGTYLTYCLLVFIKGVVERNHKDGES